MHFPALSSPEFLCAPGQRRGGGGARSKSEAIRARIAWVRNNPRRAPRSKTQPSTEINLKPTTPKAPAHLADATRAWWRSVVRDYRLEGHHLRLLQAAAEAWDRAVDAQSILTRDGLIIAGREGEMRPRGSDAAGD